MGYVFARSVRTRLELVISSRMSHFCLDNKLMNVIVNKQSWDSFGFIERRATRHENCTVWVSAKYHIKIKCSSTKENNHIAIEDMQLYHCCYAIQIKKLRSRYSFIWWNNEKNCWPNDVGYLYTSDLDFTTKCAPKYYATHGSAGLQHITANRRFM